MRWLVVVLLGAASPAGTEAAGLRAMSGGWLLDGAATARILADPTGRTDPAGPWWAAAGGTRLFGLPELPVAGAALGLGGAMGGRPWSLGAGWTRTGRDLVVEEDLVLRGRYGSGPGLGVIWRRSVRRIQGELAGRESHLALEFRWEEAGPWTVRVDLAGGDPVRWHGRAGRRNLGLLAWTRPGAGWALAVDLDASGSPRLGGQALGRLGAGVAVGIRHDVSTGVLGPTLAWRGRGMALRTSHLVHPELGVTHRFLLEAGNPAIGLW